VVNVVTRIKEISDIDSAFLASHLWTWLHITHTSG